MEQDITELHFQARQVTYNVYRYFRHRALDKNSVAYRDDDVWLTQLVAKVTGLTRLMVSGIIEEGNRSQAQEGEVDFTPKRAKITPTSAARRLEYINEKIKGIIRRKVIQFYTETNEVPTVQKLNTGLQKENILTTSNGNLLQLLLKLGFKTDSSDTEIVESPEVALHRLKYLQRIKKFRKSNTNIFFLSETLFWHLKNEPVEESLPQIIVVHANGRDSFLDGHMLKMRAKVQNDDALTMGCKTAVAAYHYGDYSWVKDNIIPFMEPKSLVVIDSPYYVEDPDNPEPPPPTTMSFTISAVKVWLDRNDIPYKDSAKRATLVNTVKSVVARRATAISKLLVRSGFSVIHLPRTHTDLNPVRMVWDSIVNQFSSLSSEERELSAFSLLVKCSTQKWKEYFRGVEALEDDYYKHDMEMDDAVDNIEFEEVMVGKPEEVKEEPKEVKEEPEEVIEEPAAAIKDEPVHYELDIEENDFHIKTEPGTSTGV